VEGGEEPEEGMSGLERTIQSKAKKIKQTNKQTNKQKEGRKKKKLNPTDILFTFKKNK